jgi:hypothetical protein
VTVTDSNSASADRHYTGGLPSQPMRYQAKREPECGRRTAHSQ